MSCIGSTRTQFNETASLGVVLESQKEAPMTFFFFLAFGC